MKKNEISSTEKLLNLIKGQEQQNPEPSAEPSVNRTEKLPRKERRPILSRISPLKEETTVGVDISPTAIKLSRVAHYPGNNRQLHDIQTVPLDPACPRTSPDFHKFLRKTLNDFCGSAKKVQVWTTISSLKVEVRLLSLPVVPKELLAKSARLTFRKEVPFDEQEMIFDYAYQGETMEGGTKKMSILAFIAPRKEINAVRDLFARSGYQLTGITVISFALQNLHRVAASRSDRKPECYLFIGSDWSRIDLYDRGALTMIREIKTGINSMVEDIADGINREIQERMEAAVSGDSAGGGSPEIAFPESSRETAEETAYAADTDSSFVLDLEGSPEKGNEQAGSKGQGPQEISLDTAKKILESQLGDVPVPAEVTPGYDLSAEKIFDFIIPSIDRLVRQIERTINHYTSSFQGKTPARLYFTGMLGTYEKLVSYTEGHLGIASSCLDPFTFTSRNLVEIPASLAERQAYAPAVGLGLSDFNRTPNFLFTQDDKGYLERLARKDRIIFAVFLGIIASCLIGYTWQNQVLEREREKLNSLRQELSGYQPETDQKFLMEMAAGISRKQQAWKEYQKRYQGMALLSELSSLTPPEITYRSCNIIMHPSGNKRGTRKLMTLNGQLQGPIQLLESSLTDFLLKLSNSPLFNRPEVERSTIKADRKNGNNDAQGTLSFRIRLNIR